MGVIPDRIRWGANAPVPLGALAFDLVVAQVYKKMQLVRREANSERHSSIVPIHSF